MAITRFPVNAKQRPSTTIEVNTDALRGSSSDSDKSLMLVGQANGGQPGVVYEIKNYAIAKQVFRSGDLLDAIELAFNPSDSAYSAGTILAERVGSAKQASATNKGLSISSQQYAADTNQIQVGLRKNTLTNAYDLQVVSQLDKYNFTYASLGNLFTVAYSGDAPYASIEVKTDEKASAPASTASTPAASGDETTTTTTSTTTTTAADTSAHQATFLILKAGADKDSATVAGQFQFGLGAYTYVGALVSDINKIDGFSAAYFAGTNKTKVDTKYIDALAETQLDADGVPVTSLGGDIVNAIQYDSVVSATYDPAKGEPEVQALTTLAGGSDGEIPTTWATEISNFRDEAGYYLVPLTADEAIHAEAVAFADDRSNNGNPTRVILGGGTNESLKQSTVRASQLRDKRTVLVANSGTRLMNNGTTKALPGYEIAAMLGGLASGVPIGDSIMNKGLDLLNIDQKFTSDELDLLDIQGVVALEYVRNRSSLIFRVTDDITTYADTEDPIAGIQSAGEASDFFVVDLREMLDSTFLGQRITVGAAKEIKTAIISFLTSEASVGTIMDFDESQISVVINGNEANISLVIVPALVLRKIKVNVIYTNETIEA